MLKPLEKDEAFPLVFRLSDAAFPFDLEYMGVTSAKPKNGKWYTRFLSVSTFNYGIILFIFTYSVTLNCPV